MKKGLGVIVSVILIMLMAGCGDREPKVVCTSDATNNGMTIKQEYILKYSGKNITNVVVTKSYAFDNNDNFKTFGTVIDNTVSNMNEMKKEYITFTSTKENKKYTTKLDVEMAKITDDELTKLGLSKELSKLEETLENQGLVCE